MLKLIDEENLLEPLREFGAGTPDLRHLRGRDSAGDRCLQSGAGLAAI